LVPRYLMNSSTPPPTKKVAANARKNPVVAFIPPGKLLAIESPTAPTITAIVKTLGGCFGLRFLPGIR